jgi:hypothetical protein
MGEVYPQDIELAILTRLKDNTSGVNAQVTTINTTRSQSTPSIADADINTERSERNPEIIVDYEESEITQYFSGGNDDLRKTCSVTVTAFLTSSDKTNIKKYVSNYIEAITKSLNNYSTGDITIILATEDILADLYMEGSELTKVGGVRFQVLINGGVD